MKGTISVKNVYFWTLLKKGGEALARFPNQLVFGSALGNLAREANVYEESKYLDYNMCC